MTGYSVFGGLEWRFAPGWSVFGEYDFVDFGKKNVNFFSIGLGGLVLPARWADTNVIRLKTQTAIVGVNYNFGWAVQSLGSASAGDQSELCRSDFMRSAPPLS
jgi:outer membrane immunogenic protein